MMDKMIKILEYNLKGKLPDPFVLENGERITDPKDWDKRKKEIYKSAVELQYGGRVPEPEFFDVCPIYLNRKNPSTYRITAGTYDKTVSFEMTAFKASQKEVLPTVVSGDGCFGYAYDPEYVNTMLNNGINFVIFNRTNLFPDIADHNAKQVIDGTKEQQMAEDIVASYEKNEKRGCLAEIYPKEKFGAISAWAWGYSRVVDALEILGFADMECIAFTGHSRGGKTAMLAGALDERAAIVNPNAACAGGCSCYRLNIKAVKEDGVSEAASEPISNILNTFPSWMGEGMRKYVDKEEQLPFDSHYLKAMVAPRILFVSEAASDIMANPVGSWQTTMGAKEVYKFLGAEDKIFWYFRSGDHFQTTEDIYQLVNVIRNYKYGEKLNDKFFKTPFEEVEFAFDWKAPQNKSNK